MEVQIYEAQSDVLCRLSGRIVLDECDRLKSSILQQLTPKISKIYLDLKNVEFIDSAGLGALVGIKITSNKHKAKFALLAPSRAVGDILTVSKLDSIFEIVTGGEADSIVSKIAKPENAREVAAPGSAPSSGGVLKPAAPGGSAPPSGQAGGGKDRIDSLCREAVEFMRKGDYQSASECYLQAIDLDPEFLTAHNNLAIVYEKRPEWHDKAIEEWKKVLELSESNSDDKHKDRALKHLKNLQRLSGS